MSQARYGAESGIHKADELPAEHVCAAGARSMRGSASPRTTRRSRRSPWNNAAGRAVERCRRTSQLSDRRGQDRVRRGVAGHAGREGRHRSRTRPRPRSSRCAQIDERVQQRAGDDSDLGNHGDGRIAGAHDGRGRSVGGRRAADLCRSIAYAAFATYDGCAALSFAGGATTNSYDSTHAAGRAVRRSLDNYGGNVGTNGNLDGSRQSDRQSTDRCRRRGPASATARPTT